MAEQFSLQSTVGEEFSSANAEDGLKHPAHKKHYEKCPIFLPANPRI